jgi:N-acetylglucosamine kinase-like BadF-type ATPase
LSVPIILLGIDGGGTKTDAWLAEAPPGGELQVVGRGRAGPGNPRSVGFSEALSQLDAAIERAFGDAARDRREIDAACICLAGCDRPRDKAAIREWTDARQVARRVLLTHDAEPILAKGTPDGHGVALISGTGSLAFGRNARGDTARVGGWGYRFGDEGSGYALAIAGLRAAARSADGRGPETCLLTRFQKHLAAENPLELIEVLYDRHATQRTFADLAPLVFEAASAGDRVAMELVTAAASDLAELVAAVVRCLSLPTVDLPLALAGSLLLKSDLLRGELIVQLRRQQSILCRVDMVSQPVLGAVAMAHSLLATSGA